MRLINRFQAHDPQTMGSLNNTWVSSINFELKLDPNKGIEHLPKNETSKISRCLPPPARPVARAKQIFISAQHGHRSVSPTSTSSPIKKQEQDAIHVIFILTYCSFRAIPSVSLFRATSPQLLFQFVKSIFFLCFTLNSFPSKGILRTVCDRAQVLITISKAGLRSRSRVQTQHGKATLRWGTFATLNEANKYQPPNTIPL